MTKYLGDGPFSSEPSSDAYRKHYDRTFGKNRGTTYQKNFHVPATFHVDADSVDPLGDLHFEEIKHVLEGVIDRVFPCSSRIRGATLEVRVVVDK